MADSDLDIPVYKIYANHNNLNYVVGEEIIIAVERYYDDNIDSYPDNIMIAPENDDYSIIQFNNNKTEKNTKYTDFIATNTGKVNLEILDGNSQVVSTVPISIGNQHENQYSIYNVPKIEVDGFETNFDNFNGMWIDSYKYIEKEDGSCNIQFDVYNTNYTYGVVEIYNADGSVFNAAVINKASSNATSIKGSLIDNAHDLLSDITNKNLLTYRQASGYSKKTSINVYVPRGGYIKITNDMSTSFIAAAINISNVLFSLKKTYTSLNGFNEGSSIEYAEKLSYNLVTNATYSEILRNPNKYCENLLNGIQKKLVLTPEGVGNVADTLAHNLDKLGEGEITKLMISSASSCGISIAESTFENLTGPIGSVLKGMFTFASVTESVLEMKDGLDCLYGRSITITVPGGNMDLSENNAVLESEGVISVYLNEVQLLFDQPPTMKNDRVMVPIRAIFEAMGYSVDWDDNSSTAKAIKNNSSIVVQIGNKDIVYTFNGRSKIYECDVVPELILDRVLVPIRAIAESANCLVGWDNAYQTVYITSSDSEAWNSLEFNVLCAKAFDNFFDDNNDLAKLMYNYVINPYILLYSGEFPDWVEKYDISNNKPSVQLKSDAYAIACPADKAESILKENYNINDYQIESLHNQSIYEIDHCTYGYYESGYYYISYVGGYGDIWYDISDYDIINNYDDGSYCVCFTVEEYPFGEETVSVYANVKRCREGAYEYWKYYSITPYKTNK